MADTGLAGLRVLLVEDEYLVADDLLNALKDAGAEVIGPAPSVSRAAALLAEQQIDAAVLDINLRGEMVWPVADALIRAGVPIVLTTGYDASTLPPSYAQLRRCEKPVRAEHVVQALRDAI